MSVDLASPPRLAAGIELLGEMKDSGFEKPPALVRRADGQMIQLSRVLYLVACQIDGTRAPGAIAALVSDDLGRELSAAQVSYLISDKLAPLGVVAGEDTPATLPKARPFLALRARGTLLPGPAANAAGALFRPLFHWPVIVTFIAAGVAMDYWLFVIHGLDGPYHQVLGDPVDMLIVVALTIASAAFHECGHAAGCRYGGARPGRIGVGIYLVWPSFFTDVTDSYRLSRAGRLRTDFGGVYFNVIFMLGLLGCYALTSNQLLLMAIVVSHLEILEQLMPLVRFDGYWILSDLVGVPDLFGRMMPVLTAAFTRGRHHSRAVTLRGPVRRIIAVWALCVIPMLAFTMGSLVVFLPEFDRSLWFSVSNAGHLVAADIAHRQYAIAGLNAIGGGFAALSGAGSAYILIRLGRRGFVAGKRSTAGYPRRRLIMVVAVIAIAVSLVVFWTVSGQFRHW